MKKMRGEEANRFFTLFIERVQGAGISLSSVSIAYYVILSLFPILITIATIVPYFNIDVVSVIGYMDSVIPGPIVDVIAPVVRSTLTRGSVGIMSVGIVVTIWSASKCMKYIKNGIDRAYGIENARYFITSRIFSIAIFIALIFLLMVFMVVFSFGGEILETFFEWLGEGFTFFRKFNAMKWTITTLALFVTFSVIYRITPSVRHRMKNALPGALFTTVCILVMVQAYAWYLGISTRSLTAHGVLSAFFVLMIWMRLLAYVILIGAVLNASILEYKNGAPQIRESRFDDLIRRGIDILLKKVGLRKGDEKSAGPQDGRDDGRESSD